MLTAVGVLACAGCTPPARQWEIDTGEGRRISTDTDLLQPSLGYFRPSVLGLGAGIWNGSALYFPKLACQGQAHSIIQARLVRSGVGAGPEPAEDLEKEAAQAELLAEESFEGTVVAPPDFCNDELRGYRLLKATNLSASQRQQVLTLAGNQVNFQVVRQALRAFFDDGGSHRHRNRDRHAWWATEEEPEGEDVDRDDSAWAGASWDEWQEDGFYYDGAWSVLRPLLAPLYAALQRVPASSVGVSPELWATIRRNLDEDCTLKRSVNHPSFHRGARITRVANSFVDTVAQLDAVPFRKRRLCTPFVRPLRIPTRLTLTAEADAFAEGDSSGLGGYILWPSGRNFWFSLRLSAADWAEVTDLFPAPLQSHISQSHISALELLAQLLLLWCAFAALPAARGLCRAQLRCDNSGAEACADKGLSSVRSMSEVVKKCAGSLVRLTELRRASLEGVIVHATPSTPSVAKATDYRNSFELRSLTT
eukprot:s7068_g3.t1